MKVWKRLSHTDINNVLKNICLQFSELHRRCCEQPLQKSASEEMISVNFNGGTAKKYKLIISLFN